MYALRLVPQYIWWHYTSAFVDIFRIVGNIFWFLLHFFSVPDTFKTFFKPWQRLQEKYHKGFSLEAFASSLVVNLLMRLVGVIMRSILLSFALVSFIVTFIVVIVWLLLWVATPPALVVLLIVGIKDIFK